MKSEELDLFDLAFRHAGKADGLALVSIKKYDDPYATFIYFDNKNEFLQHFQLKKHPLYPSGIIIPRDMGNQGNRSESFQMNIGDKIVFLNLNELYLFEDGILMNDLALNDDREE